MLIDRDALLEAIDAKCRKYFASVGITDFDYEKADEKLRWISDGAAMAVDALLDMPTIDPVKHGRWIESGDFDEHYRCSLCGFGETQFGTTWNYCPNCGAPMIDGECEYCGTGKRGR